MPNTLIIDPISTPFFVSILSPEKSHSFDVFFDNSTFAESLPSWLTKICREHSIGEIFCIVGPGNFTRMRVITLSINTLILTHSIQAKGAHFFDLILSSFPHYAPILEANAGEYLIRVGNEDTLIKKEELPPGRYMGFLEKKDFTDGITFVEYTHNLERELDYFHTQNNQALLQPIYLKKPNITCATT